MLLFSEIKYSLKSWPYEGVVTYRLTTVQLNIYCLSEAHLLTAPYGLDIFPDRQIPLHFRIGLMGVVNHINF